MLVRLWKLSHNFFVSIRYRSTFVRMTVGGFLPFRFVFFKSFEMMEQLVYCFMLCILYNYAFKIPWRVPQGTNSIHCYLSILQCNISGTLLHICYSVGSWAIHIVWNLVYSFCHLVECHSLHIHCSDIFPTIQWGLSLVVAFFDVRRVSKFFYTKHSELV